MFDWFLRFVKGIFIGSGFILPGISGGALAAVFGIYQRIIEFLADIRHNFKENFKFLLPVGLGGVFGLFVFSYLVSFIFGKYQNTILWFFIGAIVGTLPSLFKDANKFGKTRKHWLVLFISLAVVLAFLIFGEDLIGTVPQNIFTWTLGGFLIGMGVVIPGLSPSNFLIYMGMYQAMADGIKDFDLAVIIPLGIGGVLSLLTLSKIAAWLFKKAYTSMYYFIIGVVLASTIMIIPFGAKITTGYVLSSLILLVLGAALGLFMARLEDLYQK